MDKALRFSTRSRRTKNRRLSSYVQTPAPRRHVFQSYSSRPRLWFTVLFLFPCFPLPRVAFSFLYSSPFFWCLTGEAAGLSRNRFRRLRRRRDPPQKLRGRGGDDGPDSGGGRSPQALRAGAADAGAYTPVACAGLSVNTCYCARKRLCYVFRMTGRPRQAVADDTLKKGLHVADVT